MKILINLKSNTEADVTLDCQDGTVIEELSFSIDDRTDEYVLDFKRKMTQWSAYKEAKALIRKQIREDIAEQVYFQFCQGVGRIIVLPPSL